MNKIEVCPWCKEFPFITEGGPDYCISCESEKCLISPSTHWYDTEEDAIKVWNSYNL